MHFSWIFLAILEDFMGTFEEKLTRKIHATFLCACLQVFKVKCKKNRWTEWKIFQGCFKDKKEKKHLKRMGFITQFKSSYYLYRFQKKAWENCWSQSKDIWWWSIFLFMCRSWNLRLLFCLPNDRAK